MKLELYYYDACPFCQIVLNCIKKLNLEVTFCNTMNSDEHRIKLFETTGRNTVPCLFIDDSPMHESMDIIRWLESNEKHLKKV